MNDYILNSIKSGIEKQDIEFKQEIDLSDKKDRTKIARSISSIANTVEGAGYLIIGIVDQKSRKGVDQDNYIYGVQCDDVSAFELRIIQDCLKHYLNVIPNIDITYEAFPGSHRSIIIITVRQPFFRPYYFTREGDNVKSGSAFIRLGPSCQLASADDITRMVLPRKIKPLENTSDTAEIQKLINTHDQIKYAIEGELVDESTPPDDSIKLTTRLNYITNEIRRLEELKHYLKTKDRFSQEIKGLSGSKRSRIIIRQSEEIILRISNYDKEDIIFLRMKEDIIDLLEMVDDAKHLPRAKYTLAKFYKEVGEHLSDLRKAFDYCSACIEILPDFIDARHLRISISDTLLASQDALYQDDVTDAISEDRAYLDT